MIFVSENIYYGITKVRTLFLSFAISDNFESLLSW
jgi:hypothetical protein